MSIELMTKAFKAKVSNPLRKLVLIKLADNANDKGYCHPSYQHIADQCEISRQSVITHVKALQEMGVLSIKHRFNDGENTSNSFHISEKKLEELSNQSPVLGSQSPVLGSQSPVLGSQNGRKKSASDLLGSQSPVPPLVKEVDPEPSLSNHHLTVNNHHLTNGEQCHEESKKASHDRFDEFWKVYPRKESKQKAREAWQKANLDALADEIIADVINRTANHTTWKDKSFIPHPSTYLNGKRWTDEIIKATQKVSAHTGFATKDYSIGATRQDPDEWAAGLGVIH